MQKSIGFSPLIKEGYDFVLGHGEEVAVGVTPIKLEIGACLGDAQTVRLQMKK